MSATTGGTGHKLIRLAAAQRGRELVAPFEDNGT